MKSSLLLLVAAAGIAGASAQTPNTSATPKPDAASNRVTLQPGLTVAATAAALAKTTGALVVVDPAIRDNVPASVSKMTLEQGIGFMASLRHFQWRKLYLEESQIPKGPDGAVDARKLKELVQAAALAPATTVGVEDPGTGNITVTSRAPSSSPAMQAWTKGRKTVYLLYRPGLPDGLAGLPGLGNMPFNKDSPEFKKMMEDSKNMTPEQRLQAMQDGKPIMMDGDTAKLMHDRYPDLFPSVESGPGEQRMVIVRSASGNAPPQ